MSGFSDAMKVLRGLDSIARRVPPVLNSSDIKAWSGCIQQIELKELSLPSNRVLSLMAANAGTFLNVAAKREVEREEPEPSPPTQLEIETPILPDSKVEKDKHIQEEHLQLNPETTSLDILKLDLTDPQVLKEKVYVQPNAKPISVAPPKSRLSQTSNERKIPSSRIGRVMAFGNLGLGLGVGTIVEASKRVMQTGSLSGDTLGFLLNESNAERIVNTLCRVRGAALKIGQMLSIQDETFVSPELQKIFDRVRQSADYMPPSQMEKVISEELGPDWRSLFATFNETPFAAASIGQVHTATLHDGRYVAVKIQYPGVAQSIKSDIQNLLTVLNVSKLIPEAFFLDSVIEQMEIELENECDYHWEADCCTKMRELLHSQQDVYYVPEVIKDASAKRIITTELLEGLTFDECESLDQKTRNHIVESVIKLVLNELFIYRFMQTDPNWANFLYNEKTRQLGLLDFGATREYTLTFVRDYFEIIDAAGRTNDRERVLEYSRKIGFLTGYESQIMNEAHVDSVMILGECFRTKGIYEFGKQEITRRLQDKTLVMLKNRLCPPPNEIYSLHRKMSGIFLLAAKLDAKIDCHSIWSGIAQKFNVIKELEDAKEPKVAV
ncbi:Chaperone activity of bc1 complexlike_ mitochondriallike [Caligus rogercresseyi]|uniref:Chaperone activity of bc1 complexlike_ mitochondriallike n=1 Tax=Caligus rogercresseyi TaxID=217165 RepID=A0A7T8KB69_CALRO|nr:Chaperone activity of bc1 complexlike_ mitochondriallike [Caligus rogercresseyi]